MSFMSLFMKPGDEQPRKRKRNVKEVMLQQAQQGLQSQLQKRPEDLLSVDHSSSQVHQPPPLADIFEHDLFAIPSNADPMFCKPEDLYHHPVNPSIGVPSQVTHVFSSLTIATSPRDGALQKSCSVCGRMESKTCKIGHRLQSCKERNHTECKLVCNSCEDFFRRHSGGVNLKEHCDSSSRDPSACLGGKSSKNCQYHRYERCLDVGMQPVSSKVDAKDVKQCLSPIHLSDASFVLGTSPPVSTPVPSTPVSAQPALEPPITQKQSLPDWGLAQNMFNVPEMRWRAFCTSLGISSSAEMPNMSIEEFLAQKIEYSDLLMRYSGEEASAIWHERGSLRLCVESFFAVSRDGFSPSDLATMHNTLFGVPVCVHVDYVAQKLMNLGRDLVPVQVPSTMPLNAKAYQAYRSSIPNVVATIERKEKTTTPPFAVNGGYLSSRALSVSFVLTSKIPGKTWLYLRRKGEKTIIALMPEDPVEIFDGDTLSIWNESTEMAEHIAWRLSIPQAMQLILVCIL